MNLQFSTPVKLCNQCLIARGLRASLRSGLVVALPTATQDEVELIMAFLAVATPCTHSSFTEPQRFAADEWAAKNAALASLPGVSDPDARIIETA